MHFLNLAVQFSFKLVLNHPFTHTNGGARPCKPLACHWQQLGVLAQGMWSHRTTNPRISKQPVLPPEPRRSKSLEFIWAHCTKTFAFFVIVILYFLVIHHTSNGGNVTDRVCKSSRRLQSTTFIRHLWTLYGELNLLLLQI